MNKVTILVLLVIVESVNLVGCAAPPAPTTSASATSRQIVALNNQQLSDLQVQYTQKVTQLQDQLNQVLITSNKNGPIVIAPPPGSLPNYRTRPSISSENVNDVQELTALLQQTNERFDQALKTYKLAQVDLHLDREQSPVAVIYRNAATTVVNFNQALRDYNAFESGDIKDVNNPTHNDTLVAVHFASTPHGAFIYKDGVNTDHKTDIDIDIPMWLVPHLTMRLTGYRTCAVTSAIKPGYADTPKGQQVVASCIMVRDRH